MPSEEIKEKLELEIFHKFAEVCPLQITSSIQKRQPPYPDILCEFKGIGQTFFELVELTDENFNSLLHSRYELEKLFENAAQQRAGFIEKFANACIWVVFKPNVKSSKYYIEKILDLLLSGCIPKNLEGDVLFPANQSEEGKDIIQGWSNKIEILEVRRDNNWDHQTPCFWTTKMEPVDIGRVLRRVKEKFEKTYNLHPVNQAELLGYFNFHPPPPLYRWKDDVHKFVQSHLSHSSFKRIWIFDYRKKSLLYVYPDL